jgi:glycosyltransferase involved in cell wall biosynthesis
MPRAEIRPPVAHIIDELPAHGAERLLADLLRHRSEAFRYHVVCLVRGGELEDEIRQLGVPVTVLGYRGRWDLSLAWRLARWLRANRIAVVHTHLFTADTWGRLAAWLGGVRAMFTTVHSTNEWKSPLYRAVDRLLAGRSTRVIACSDEVGEILVHRDRLPAARVQVIPNGVALDRFAAVAADGVRAEWGVPPSRVLLTMVGRFHPAKGHARLVGALARLRARGVACHCLFVGDGDLRPELEREVEGAGLAGMVTFTGQRSDIPRILAATDVLVVPSRWEGLPIILLEGMAMGRAVVASAVGGIPGVIAHGRNGLLVNPGDEAELATTLERVATDGTLRARLGQAAHETVRSRYSVERTATAYEALYHDALGWTRPALVGSEERGRQAG